MRSHRVLQRATLALALGIACAASAQAPSTPSSTSSNPPVGMNNPAAPDNDMKAGNPNTSFSTWMTDYSKKNNGRISRQAYMDEAGRRWDAMDANKQGLTTDQINGMYGWSAAGDANNGAPSGAMSKGK